LHPRKRGRSEGGRDKASPSAELLNDKTTSIEAATAYRNDRNVDFELDGIWDGDLSQEWAVSTDAATDDGIIMGVAEQPHLIINSIALNTEAHSIFALERFLSDTGPWSVYNMRGVQANDTMPKPRHRPPPGRHVM
jgi:hypothetical protein